MPYANVVAETSVTTGTGAYALSGPILNTRTFLAGLTHGAVYGYRVAMLDGYTVGFEVGTGTWDSSAQTFARTNVEDSSNAGAAVDWPAGTKLIEITLTAAQLAALGGGGGGATTKIDDSDVGGIYGDITGLINGLNTVFTLSQAYTAGTLEIELIGQGVKGSDITETTPGSGVYTLGFAPETGTYMKAKYQ